MVERTVALGLILLIQFPAVGEGQKRATPLVAQVAYEAEVEASKDGRTFEVMITYDRGRFRQLTRFPGTPRNIPPSYLELYDGSPPHILWVGDLNEKTVRPDSMSIRQALSREAERDGIEVVRHRYGIPARIHIRPRSSNIAVRASFGVPVAKELLAKGRWQPSGSETVSGYSCSIYEKREDGISTEKMWVEPRSGLVLKQETHFPSTPGNPAPPRVVKFQVRRLKLLDRVSPKRFQIPVGFTAIIPRLFNGVALPKGVNQKAATGAWAATGIAYQ